MKRWLRELVKFVAFVASVYIALEIIPAKGWYILTAIAIGWLFHLSKQIEGMVKLPVISSDPSRSLSVATPRPLRAKYIFLVKLDAKQTAGRLQLTPEEETVFEQCERWPRALQVDQWGELLRWRLYIHGQDAAVSEWDAERGERFTIWEANLESGNTLIGAQGVHVKREASRFIPSTL